MDKALLDAIAHDANFTAMAAERIAAHATTVNQINEHVANAALERLSLDRPPRTFDTLRAPYAAKSGPGIR